MEIDDYDALTTDIGFPYKSYIGNKRTDGPVVNRYMEVFCKDVFSLMRNKQVKKYLAYEQSVSLYAKRGVGCIKKYLRIEWFFELSLKQAKASKVV